MGEFRLGVSLTLCLLFGAAGSAFAQETFGPVTNETLWSVATKVNAGRPTATAQMAWALYRANPEAFDGSPSRIRPKSILKVPGTPFVSEVPAAQAYAYLTGKATPPAAPAVAAAPVPAAPVPAPASTGAPVVTGAQLAPPVAGEPFRWLAIAGSGFAPGATLELRDLASGTAATARKPQSVRSNRIEYAGRFPDGASRWEVAVRNPDGRRSAPFAFAAGVAAAAAPAEPTIMTTPLGSSAFAGSAEQSAAAAMVNQRRSPEEVYGYLAPFEDRYAGDVDYDYLFGTTAYDAGRYSQAIFILQRAVATRPNFAGARMELGRAYYAQGDNESARREFVTLEKDDPPPEARRVIAEYMAAIDRRASVYQSQLSGYAELGTGYDSNANGAPDIQDFIGFQLDSRNQATASSYYNLGAGGLVSYPFKPGWRLFGTGSAGYRGNPDASFVDSQVLRIVGALEWRPNVYELSLAPNFAMAMLDGEDNHQVVGVDLAGTRHFDRARVSLNVRSAQTRYADGLEVLDVDTLVFGVAGQYTTTAMPRVQYVGAVTFGSDDAVEPGSAFERDIMGARAGAVIDFGRGHAMLAALAFLTADYDPSAFGERSDDQLAATFGYEWGGWRALGWTLRGTLNYTDNSSSVALYEYDRVDAGVSVRKEFR